MKNNGIIRKTASYFLVLVMLLGVFIPTQSVLAESKKVDVTITDFNITNSEGVVPPNGYFSNTLFKLNYKWDASNHENKLNEGDYFELDLPNQFKFPAESSYCNFDINAPTGEVMAKAVITPKDPGGGKIKVTFTGYVNDKFNITGDMHLTARWNTTTYPVEQEGEYEVVVGSFKPHITLKPYIPPQYGTEILYKVSGQTLTENDLVRWRIRVNAKQGNLNNVIIKDTLEVEDPGSPEGIEYVSGEFILYEIIFKDGEPVEKNPVNVSNQVTLSSDKRSFTYSMGNLDGKAYMLHYRSTYRQGLKLKNTAELTSTETGKIVYSQFQDSESGGGGQGNLTSKIKIVKIDDENNEVKLKNAKFKITRKATGKSFEMVTDENGEAVSMQLIPGEYTIEELDAPSHYILDSTTVHTVTVTSDKVALQTIKNKPEKINIKVQKKWVGPLGSEVTVVLKADGVQVAEHKLSAPDWEYTFTGLRKYNAQTGEEIKYIAEEKDILQGYIPSISGSMGDGFIITNTNNEKVDIPVEKKWVGPSGNSIVVQVKAEGSNIVIQEHELKASEDWKHTFTGLRKYAADGTPIKYKVVEKNVPQGYEVTYDKDSSGKWVITNTNVEKTEVSVKKKWIGAERDSVLVELRAEGINDVIKEYELKKSEGWKHNFTGLDKYATDGSLIKYKVVEKNVPQGYTATYEQESDNLWIIKNTQDKTKVKVTKEWEGVTGNHPTIKLQLLKNGQNEGKPIELINGTTTHTWSDLDKTDAQGKDYEYTVKEVGETGGYVKLEDNWYKVKYEGDAQKGFTIKNKKLPLVTPMIPPTREIKVTKDWKDHNGKTITAPTDKITVELYKDGEATGKTLELNESNNWTAAFKKLPVSETLGGTNHEYTVKEVGEEGNVIKFDGKKYKVVYGGSMKEGFTVTNEKEEPPTPPSVEKPKIPPTPKSKLPKTGYGSNVSIYTMMTILSTVVLIALKARKKRKES